jgi:hypothetical protein
MPASKVARHPRPMVQKYKTRGTLEDFKKASRGTSKPQRLPITIKNMIGLHKAATHTIATPITTAQMVAINRPRETSLKYTPSLKRETSGRNVENIKGRGGAKSRTLKANAG